MGVKQALKSFDESVVINETKLMIAALERYEIGTHPNCFHHLHNIRDKKILDKTRVDLSRSAKANPDRRKLIVYVCSGYGLSRDGIHFIPLNQYSKRSGWYEMFGIENEIRYIAKKHANSYCIGIFFTARETYRSHHHSGCLRTKADALSELCLHIAGRLEHMPDDEEKEKAQKLLAEHQAEMAFDEEREKVQKLLAEHQAEMEKLKQTEMQPEESAGLELDKSQARKPVTYYGLPEWFNAARCEPDKNQKLRS